MTKKLDNREHSFDCELAEIHGVPKALLLKNISYWVEHNESEGVLRIGSKHYTRQSLNAIARRYTYLPKGNLPRWLSELKEDGWLLIVKNDAGQNLFSTGPVYDAWKVGGDWKKAAEVFQNETAKNGAGCFKMKHPLFQNETTGVFQNETLKDTESNTELEDVESMAQKPKKGVKKEKPKPAMTPKELATLFDAVALEKFTAADIQFQPMNWKAAPMRDFAALNKILEFVTADVVNKTPEEIRKGVEYIFKYGWDLMARNAQGGGAVQFYPHVIQRNYTQILNHARASHQPKPPNQSGGKQSFAERRNAAEQQALRELILDFSAPSGEPEW